MENFLQNFRHHIGHTVLLILILFFGFTLFFAFSHDTEIRIMLLFLVSASYAIWGVVHHYVRRDLTWGIALEYISVAFLAGIGILSILGWGIQ
jgi:hypothetical protein